MKLFLVIAASWLYQNVAADFNPNAIDKDGKLTGKQPINDIKYTGNQRECFLNADTSAKCESSSRGFDTSVAKWDAYMKEDDDGNLIYPIPMLVDTNSYSPSMLQTLWESLIWARKEFEDHTQIRLVFIDEYAAENTYNKGYIKPFYGGACWSYLGNLHITARWKYQKMDIGWCYNVRGSIVHETMHALGFVHEHMRSDRDTYVSVSSSNAANCKKYVKGRLDVSGTEYDLRSIMHYPEGACGIRVKDRNLKGLVGNRKNLSTLDIEEINKIYPAE